MNPIQDLGTVFRALSDPTRLTIYEFLCAKHRPVAVDEAGDVRPLDGVTVGEVCCHVTGSDRFSSTVSHHLRELRLAGLIRAEKQGRFMVCSADRQSLESLIGYLTRLSELAQAPVPARGGAAR